MGACAGMKERSGCKGMITVHDHQSTLSRCFLFPAIFMIHQKRGRDELFKKSKTECEEFNRGLVCRHWWHPPIYPVGTNFIDELGYSVKQNIVHQDNKSTILLAKNGHWLSIELKTNKRHQSSVFLCDKMWWDIVEDSALIIQWSLIMNVPKDNNGDKESTKIHQSLLAVRMGQTEKRESIHLDSSVKNRHQEPMSQRSS